MLDIFCREYIYEYRENWVSFGNLNQNKTYYAIRCLAEKQRLLNSFIEVLRKIQYANLNSSIMVEANTKKDELLENRIEFYEYLLGDC